MQTTALQMADALGHQPSDKRLDILRRIGELGSISQAARAAGVSYKAAWQAIDTLGNLAGVPLLEKTVGGAGGGGARLTSAGRSLLEAAEKMQQARARVLQPTPADAALDAALPTLSALGLRTSMRNQLPCSVANLRRDAGAVSVELHLADQTPLRARITRESVDLLNLKPGLAVLALCKATAVGVATSAQAQEGRNLLAGQVSRASRSTRGGEVALALPSGLKLVGFCAPGVVLTVGQPAIASIDLAAVVIALRD